MTASHLSHNLASPVYDLMGMRLASIDRFQLLDHIFTLLTSGVGGWVITANLDFLRRYTLDKNARTLYDAADIRVADGAPLVWATRLQGNILPERISGSTFIWLLAERAAREKRSLYLLGGDTTANQKAVNVLAERYPGILICGHSSPSLSSPPTDSETAKIREELVALNPDILLVGMGSPKQEQLISSLRLALPMTWMLGVGISFSFVAGHIRRAPAWMQKTGMEWIHRLMQEPQRLARRYLIEDLPFAIRLFAHAFRKRLKNV